MTMINAYDTANAGALDPDDKALIERRAQALGPAYRLFYEKPLHIVRGEGVWLWDKVGKKYLDAYNNVASVGHCPARRAGHFRAAWRAKYPYPLSARRCGYLCRTASCDDARCLGACHVHLHWIRGK